MIGDIREDVSENFEIEWSVEEFPLRGILVSMVNGCKIGFQGLFKMVVSTKK